MKILKPLNNHFFFKITFPRPQYANKCMLAFTLLALVLFLGACGGSSGGDTSCSSASATSKISLPSNTTLANSAIEFFTSSTNTELLELQLGGQPVSRFQANGMRRVCIPDWAKGTVQDLTLALTRRHTTGSCAIPRARDIVIDAVSVVSDHRSSELLCSFFNIKKFSN